MTATLFALLAFAIGERESGNNPNVKDGKHGEAGQYQITAQCLADVNERRGTRFEREDCYVPETARHIMYLYLDFWGEHYYKVTHRIPTVFVYARIWNRGPNGWAKQDSYEYGLAVKALVEERAYRIISAHGERNSI